MAQESVDSKEVSEISDDQTPEFVVKYEKPKIIGIDLDQIALDSLRDSGFNVSMGSFGKPYKVKVSDQYTPVIQNHDIPSNVTEQEIVIIDLHSNDFLNGPIGIKETSDGTADWWLPCSEGIVDPRTRSMVDYQNVFANIYEHGGIFIIFAAPRYTQPFVMARIDKYGFHIIIEIPFDNWSFIPFLNSNNLQINREYGEEIEVSAADYPLVPLLRKYLTSSTFDCTFSIPSFDDEFTPLATNKYGKAVAAIAHPPKAEGRIFILPNIEDKAGFLVEFVRDLLPSLVPKLFPESENSSWSERSEYEFPEIIELKSEIEQIQTEADDKVTALHRRIEVERASRQYLVDLLSASGTELVNAVKRALEVLGYQSVTDVDEASEQKSTDGFLTEDLRIEENGQWLLAEVKGVNGTPSDADSVQVQKHIPNRMRELKTTAMTGLTIINHQRHLPPLDRENKAPFRQLILDNAERDKLGLITTWDFVRLVRSFLVNGWSPDNVKPVLFRHGRIEPVPEHYEYVGKVQDFYEKIGVVSILVESATMKRGDRIGYELPVEFREQDAASLEMHKEPVEEAVAGETVALKTGLTKEEARKGTRVFRVKSEHN